MPSPKVIFLIDTRRVDTRLRKLISDRAAQIAALPDIQKQLKYARIVIAGDGPLRAELEELARQLGVSVDVIFAGDVREVNALYHCFDVLVYPSTHGAFGLVVLEAMACSVPVVASELDGTMELITPDQTGLLAPPTDSRAIAQTVIALMADRHRKDQIAAAAYQNVVANFSATGFGQQHLSLYRSLLEQRR